jgi:hypothetical protein
VPVKPLVIDVMFVASAVIVNMSVVSVLIAGVADEVMVFTRCVIRFDVNVWALVA